MQVLANKTMQHMSFWTLVEENIPAYPRDLPVSAAVAIRASVAPSNASKSVSFSVSNDKFFTNKTLVCPASAKYQVPSQQRTIYHEDDTYIGIEIRPPKMKSAGFP